MPDIFDWPKLVFAVGVPLALVAFVVVYVFRQLIPRMMDSHTAAMQKQGDVFTAAMAEQRTDLLAHTEKLAGIFERRLDTQIAADREMVATISEDLKSMANGMRELSQAVLFNVQSAVRREEEEQHPSGPDLERQGARKMLQGRHGEGERH